MDRDAPSDTTSATFAMGCFWGPDALFGALDGVVRTRVGYAGGTTPAPTYDDIGDHIEAVQVEYDSSALGYDRLLDCFWTNHDPTRAPFKRQYQPALFPRTEAQIEQARASAATVADRLDASLSTDVIEDAPFYRAEAYHQKYKLRHHPELMQAFRAIYPDEEAFTNSPAAALVNGYVGGHRPPRHLDDDLPRLGLPSTATEALQSLVARKHAGA